VARPHPPAIAQVILARLEEQHPEADTELHFRTPFELLVATILSAQSTDQRVNMVTPALFEQYPDAGALAVVEPETVEPLIVQTGFFRQKAKAIVGMSRLLVERHGGEVPADMDALVALPGVGRKTANVVLGHALGVPGLPVDRHVLRVSNRLGVATSDDPEEVEQQLCAAFPPERWTRVSDTLILHGRRICRPTPRCDDCAARDDCRFYQSAVSERARAGDPRLAPARGRPAQGAKPPRKAATRTARARPKAGKAGRQDRSAPAAPRTTARRSRPGKKP
jgi:endonuclease III